MPSTCCHPWCRRYRPSYPMCRTRACYGRDPCRCVPHASACRARLLTGFNRGEFTPRYVTARTICQDAPQYLLRLALST
jgi:hypothetical protein